MLNDFQYIENLISNESVNYDNMSIEELTTPQSNDTSKIIIEFYQECMNLRQKVMTESMLLGAVALGAVTYAIGIKNMLKLLGMLITALGKLISMCINAIKSIFGAIFGKLGGGDGAISSAVSRVKNVWNDRIVVKESSNPLVLNNGLSLDYVGRLSTLSSYLGHILHIYDETDKLLNGDIIFSSKDDMQTILSLERNRIAKLLILQNDPYSIVNINIPMNMSALDLKHFLEECYFSPKGLEHTYTLNDIISVFNNYNTEASEYKIHQKGIEDAGKGSLKYLSDLQNKISKDNTLIANTKDSITEQINLLIEYKSSLMNSGLIAMECYMKYISRVHLQCKAILQKVITISNNSNSI